jgi:hypothetical protein
MKMPSDYDFVRGGDGDDNKVGLAGGVKALHRNE